MRDIQREIADKYQEFFNFMNQEHELILTIEQMNEIVFEAERLVKKLTIPAVVGRSEQLKAEVFTLANKLAVAGEGDAAVSMHRIHNRL